MSTTPSITLTGPQNEYMYKKTLGVGYEYPNTQPSAETISSLPYIFNEQIIPQIIPIPAPDKITQESITGGGTKWTTNTPYIFYYEKLPLNINPDSLRYSFVYNSTQIDNLTTQSIPSNYDPNNQSYNIFVFDVNNTQVIDTNYIFDNATGCLTFINGPFNPTYSGIPYISFYRYEGPFGVNGATGSTQWTTSGSNIFYNTGNVGIGTANPVYKLDVNGNINGATGSFSYLSTSQGITGATGSFSYLSASQQMIAPAGITGATGSFSYLSASQQMLAPAGITGATGSFSYLSNSQGITGTTGSFSYLSSTNNTYLASETLSKVGIGTTNPNYTLDVNGVVGALSFQARSDYRIKKDIRTLDKEFTIDNLNPVIYKLIDNGQIQSGFIAHEVQEYYPFLVNGDKDGERIQSINYSGLIPILVKEIQDLKKEISNIKDKLLKYEK